MRASIVDLRYKMKDVLKALERNEEIDILYHGKVKGRIIKLKTTVKLSVTQHPFFGMQRQHKTSVRSQMNSLRKDRYHAV